MPLLRADDNKQVFKIPYEETNMKIINKLADADKEAIYKNLNEQIDQSVSKKEGILTSSWIPGKNWSGTVFQPIYIACNKNDTRAGMIFGVILFDVFMKRPEKWYYGRYQLNGEDIRGLTYFMSKDDL